jgi:hypothetical protein
MNGHSEKVDHEYDGVMHAYKELTAHGMKKEADHVMNQISSRYPKGTQAPPEEFQHGLEALLHHGSGHETSHDHKPEGAWAPVVSLLETIGGFFYGPAKESHKPGHAPAYAGLPAHAH